MTDHVFLKWISSLGVGGVLAGGIFWVYRKDALANQARLEQIHDRSLQVTAHVMAALASLQQTIARLEGRLGGAGDQRQPRGEPPPVDPE